MATTVAPIVAYTHKAPVMFCAPGSKQDPKTSFGVYGDSIDSIVPWPGGSQLRIATLSSDAVPSWVLDIIKSVVDEWTRGMGEALTVQWLSAGSAAQIRISFRTDVPNWSCVGARARLYDQSKPTMNFNFGGWKDNKAVYSHAYIKRLAAHLFGHALGLPHAQVKQTLSYNKAELEKVCGAYDASMIQSAKGCQQLQDSRSIMHYDLPSSLASNGADALQGGSVIDSGARSLLRSLYPLWPKPLCGRYSAKDRYGFKAGVNANGIANFGTNMTNNIVAGLCRLDMGTNGNFRLQSKITNIQKDGYTWEVGTWSDTNLYDASYSILSFEKEDRRIQTGNAEWKYLSGGKSRSTYRRFTKPFKTIPEVVVFITGFDTLQGRNIRLDVSASNIDRNGFTVNMMTWADTEVINLTVSWIAHESDEWTIRSGSLRHSVYPPNMTREASGTSSYRSPMPKPPSYIFLAFTHIDAPVHSNIRLDLGSNSTQEGMTGVFTTWEEESKFYRCEGCYVAFC
ncbi:ATP synthase subunits region orf 7 [Fusarium mundagurra]|uniref:ATP synthase subunits region orf 7 n=1 Tax=Fusarium mundagurra TaxID=1567541 RepID=A0A8H5Y4S2_9HYPO|nr:ATP synthase subunits region orf 7 [Fusarium mundagurra]